MEFQGVEARSIRCSLSCKINMIDKFVFVNALGAKVIERSRMGLARELKDGNVIIFSEAPLIDRAIETVIGKLRNSGESNALLAHNSRLVKASVISVLQVGHPEHLAKSDIGCHSL